MGNVTVGILGLGRTGASVALALKRYNERKDAQHVFEVTAADMRAGIREDAQKIGLTEHIQHDLFHAARDKDIVVIALPYADVQLAYKEIGHEIRSGAVVLDMSPLKLPSLEWAKKYLHKEAHHVGLTAVLNPKYLFDGLDDTLHAAPDLFDKGNMLLMPSASCVKEAVELAADFSTLLGTTPHYFDPAEHDSLVALTEGLPALLGLVSFYASARGSGWGDAQRITNPPFGRLTRPLYDTHPDDLRDIWLLNRDNLIRHLDEFTAALQNFRKVIAAGDRDALEAALIDASDTYSAWINRRHNAKWDDDKTSAGNQSISNMIMGSFMGSFLSKRLQGDKSDDEK
jgi:prephenate dehydrogenase